MSVSSQFLYESLASELRRGHVHIADCKFFVCVVNAHGSACVELDRDCSVITGKKSTKWKTAHLRTTAPKKAI